MKRQFAKEIVTNKKINIDIKLKGSVNRKIFI